MQPPEGQKPDTALSLHIAKLFDTQLQVHACYKNALLTACMHKLTYVEGVVAGVVPLDHAWCEDKDGNVIDPTFAMLELTGITINDWADYIYFAGDRFAKPLKLLNETLPVASWPNQNTAGYTSANDAAYKALFGKTFSDIKDTTTKGD